VREAANAHDFAGYDYSPLEEAKILDFIDKLHELVRRAESDLKKLQVGHDLDPLGPVADRYVE
jgi:DNA repair protein RAD50